MQAPDKIYVQCPSSKWIGQLWNEKPLRTKEDNVNYLNATNIEYIRKDAILEWAKEQKAKYQTVAYANGERRILNELIDKLNSL